MKHLQWSLLLFFLLTSSVSVHADGRFFDSDGVRIHYQDLGDGIPLVLIIHSGDGRVPFWEQRAGYDLQGALVAVGYRVLAIDLRGYGKSDRLHDPAAYGLEMSRDIARMLDHLDIEKAHVMGYAQGGLVANWMRREFPDRMLTVTIGGGGLMPEDSLWVVHADEFADGIAKMDMTAVARETRQPGQPIPSREEARAMYAEYFKSVDHLALSAMVRAQAIPDSAAELGSNTVPALVLIGEHDHNRRDVTAMASYMSNMELVVIPGSTHHDAVRGSMYLAEFLKFLSKNR